MQGGGVKGLIADEDDEGKGGDVDPEE